MATTETVDFGETFELKNRQKIHLVNITFYYVKLYKTALRQPRQLSGKTHILMSVRKIKNKHIGVENYVENRTDEKELMTLQLQCDRIVNVSFYYINNTVKFKKDRADINIVLDVGESNQAHGDCLRCDQPGKLPERCLQRNVFLWKGNTYGCDDDTIHDTRCFCRQCAECDKNKPYLYCPIHEDFYQCKKFEDRPPIPVYIH